ncbi:Ankyrin repeat domain containing protein [Pandoravirus salinus]|uniref:Ankyrin repeat domain containing protein n=1 Tax=Pandoravirus salinus TaxID=1349410 RepID=A0A291ATU2_9VIRU|nr:ankyrin repeat domain [Pandoravirus salinus]ATE82274.1 Ankyrin repeat domain containing protein [Pandoravirus salinus]
MKKQKAHRRPRKRRRTIDGRTLAGAVQGPTVIDMPSEILYRIAGLLDDVSFCAIRLAHRRFRVHMADEIERVRRVPRWLRADREQLCRQGDAVAVRALCKYGAPFTLCHLYEAAAHGHLDVVAAIHDRGTSTRSGWVSAPPRPGRTERRLFDYWITPNDTAVDFFGEPVDGVMHQENNFSVAPTSVMNITAGNGHLDVVKFLHDHRTEGCTTDAMNDAAAFGHLDVVKFLHANRSEGCTPRAIVGAARLGHVDMVAWLYRNRPECAVPPSAALDDAARYGHTDVVLFLHDRAQVPLTQTAMAKAVVHGHFDVAVYMRSHGIDECRPEDMDEAAGNGHLDMLRFLQWTGTARCTPRAMTLAALSGHLDVVVYLHENRTEGCTVDALASPGPQIAAFLRRHYEFINGKMVRIDRDSGPKRRRLRRRRRDSGGASAPSEIGPRDHRHFFAAAD